MGALREGVLVGSGAVGCLPYPSHLSAPVTLTLTLSRRAGEGIFPSPPFPFGWTVPSCKRLAFAEMTVGLDACGFAEGGCFVCLFPGEV